MHHKLIIILVATVLFCSSSIGQEHQTVLSTPSEWKTEIIPFPLGFAREIDLVGFEDLRFAPNWSDATSPNFWTYTFVWYVDKGAPMTEERLTGYFNAYYDGLMGVTVKDKEGNEIDNGLDKTLCLFVKTNDGFSGKMRVYDKFFSKEYMTLNIKVTESFCPKTNKQIVSCNISPQPFDNTVWKLFEEVMLIVTCE